VKAVSYEKNININTFFLNIHHFDKERKMKRELTQRISEYREKLNESKSNDDSKDDKQEIIMFAKKLLEKEGFVVERLREKTDFEDEE
jgi:hypothetical protein